jgi:hypothetical protein
MKVIRLYCWRQQVGRKLTSEADESQNTPFGAGKQFKMFFDKESLSAYNKKTTWRADLLS